MRIYQYFCFLVFTFLKVALYAQSEEHDRQPEIENHQKRADWFYSVHYDSTVANAEFERWKAYTKIKSDLLKTTDEMPVADWRSCGPSNQSGRIISHAFDPFNSDILWAGSATGGLWKTENSGDSWQPMSDGIPSLAIGAIGIDPQNNQNMLIGTGEGYLLASGFLYGVGVLKSNDGGLTWQMTALSFDDSLKFASLAIAWDYLNSDLVYIATTFGIYKSEDGGDTWELKLPGTATTIQMHPQQPNILFAALQPYDTDDGGIYRSTDDGENWELLTNGLPPSSEFGFTSMSICESFPDVMVIGVANNLESGSVGTLRGVFKSSDGGDTWIQLPSTIDFYCYPEPYEYICQGWYNNTIRISPSDTNKIFSAGIYFYKTIDGGMTWDFSDNVPGSENYMHPDHHSFGVDPENDSRLFDFNDGGVYKSVDDGLTWENMNNGLMTTQFYYIACAASDKNVVMGGTQDNGIWYNNENDTETEWEQYTYGDGFQCAIDFEDPDNMYATELFQGRMRSKNGGNSFQEINNGITESNYFIVPLIMHPSNSNILFTASNSRIYKTTNTGDDWENVAQISNITMFCFDHVNPEIMYACIDPYYDNSKIYISIDGGESWERADEPGNKITDIETDPYAAGVLYATRSRYTAGTQVWKSLDYGESWTNISGDLPTIPANTIAIDERNSDYLYVGTNLGVFVSINGGAEWTSYNDNFPNVIVDDLIYFPSDTTLRAGTHGRGVCKHQLRKWRWWTRSSRNLIIPFPSHRIQSATKL